MTYYSVEYVVGGILVALYAFERINTPKISLETTTAERYWSMVLAYVAASLVLYFTLAMSLGLVGLQTLKKFEILPGSINETSPPVLMALLLTLLLSKIPGLSKIDEAVRREFRNRASMSRIAGNLSHPLERSPMQLKASQQAAIVATLKGQGSAPTMSSSSTTARRNMSGPGSVFFSPSCAAGEPSRSTPISSTHSAPSGRR